MAYKMKPKGTGNNSYGMMPSNNKPKNKMVTIPGAGERRVVGGAGLFGYLAGGASKLAMHGLAKATGHAALKSGGKTYGYSLKGGKLTNSLKGILNNIKKEYFSAPKGGGYTGPKFGSYSSKRGQRRSDGTRY